MKFSSAGGKKNDRFSVISRFAREQEDRIIHFIEMDTMTGLCVACGSERDCTEPDAEDYDCPECGEDSVFGCEQLLFYM